MFTLSHKQSYFYKELTMETDNSRLHLSSSTALIRRYLHYLQLFLRRSIDHSFHTLFSNNSPCNTCSSVCRLFNCCLSNYTYISSKPGKFRIALKNFCKHTHFTVLMNFLTNSGTSGNSGVYPAVLHIYQYLLKHNLCKTYVRTLYLCIVSLLPIF